MDHKLLGRFRPVWRVQERGTGKSSDVRSYRNLTFATGPVNDGFVPEFADRFSNNWANKGQA